MHTRGDEDSAEEQVDRMDRLPNGAGAVAPPAIAMNHSIAPAVTRRPENGDAPGSGPRMPASSACTCADASRAPRRMRAGLYGPCEGIVKGEVISVGKAA